MAETDPYSMLYCDQIRCRVNTFEAGDDSTCPGCGHIGENLSDVRH